AFFSAKSVVDEDRLQHAGHAGEHDQIGLGDGAVERAKPLPRRQLLPGETNPERLHASSPGGSSTKRAYGPRSYRSARGRIVLPARKRKRARTPSIIGCHYRTEQQSGKQRGTDRNGQRQVPPHAKRHEQAPGDCEESTHEKRERPKAGKMRWRHLDSETPEQPIERRRHRVRVDPPFGEVLQQILDLFVMRHDGPLYKRQSAEPATRRSVLTAVRHVSPPPRQ